ncbi:MAG: CaiB/BaiF CoA transferase family protein [Nocardioidaceae bacterium]
MSDADSLGEAAPEAGSAGPLAGVTVLDLSTQLPGPYTTMLLRALGARVIKVEPPGGDAARRIDPAMFARINAGKELIQLDLKTDEGRQIIHGLSRRANVFIEGFRPGVVQRLGVDFATLAELSPGIVYCSLSGFGQSGPLANLPAHDLNLLALAGGVSTDSDYRQVSIPAVDLAAGSNAALAITAALSVASRTATFLDLSLLDAALVWSAVKRVDAGEGLEPTYGVFDTADGGRVAISAMEDDVWQRLCEALRWADWQQDPDLQVYAERRQRAAELSRRLEETIKCRPVGYWLDLAQRHQLPLTAVLDTAAMFSHPQNLERELWHEGQLQAPMPSSLRVVVATPPGGIDAQGAALRREAAAVRSEQP